MHAYLSVRLSIGQPKEVVTYLLFQFQVYNQYLCFVKPALARCDTGVHFFVCLSICPSTNAKFVLIEL